MVTIDNTYIADCGFYINLDHRKDRKKKVENQLNIFNIQGVERIPAVIKGQYAGCGESHKNIVKEAKKRNAKSIIVFEDDFYIMDPPTDGYTNYYKSFKETFHEVLDQASKIQWDILFFGAILHAPLLKVSNNLGKIQLAKSAHAFIIKESLFEHILNWSYEKYDQLDHYFYTHLQKSHIFLSSYPVLINYGHPEEDMSDLLKRKTTYHNYLLSTYREFAGEFRL